MTPQSKGPASGKTANDPMIPDTTQPLDRKPLTDEEFEKIGACEHEVEMDGEEGPLLCKHCKEPMQLEASRIIDELKWRVEDLIAERAALRSPRPPLTRIRLDTDNWHRTEIIINPVEFARAQAPEAFAESRLNQLFAKHVEYLIGQLKGSPRPSPADREHAKRIAEYFYDKLPDGELKYTAADYLRDGILPAPVSPAEGGT